MKLIVATRSPGKIREIRAILSAYPALEPIDLDEAGIAESAEEDALEAFSTFQENALAKARYFAARAGQPVLADDSGICVDALGGAPGVRSRRFAPGGMVRGVDQDVANNEHLLRLLAGLPPSRRGAEYVCAAACVGAGGAGFVETGTCRGRILEAPRGSGGFGYDPLFFLEDEGCTFGELPPARKHEISHRGIAVRAVAERLARG